MSSEARFDVVLTGEIHEGFLLEDAKEAFSRLFALSEENVEKLFSVGKVAIKKNIPKARAEKFLDTLREIGVMAHIAPVGTVLAPEPGTENSAAPGTGESAVTDEPRVSDRAGASPPTLTVSATTAQSSGGRQDFRFHGEGGEYFRIWIVNILLTIATLGIYSAWAKVRNAQYFYGNTELAGSRFAYLAKPLTILKGRIIAVLCFVLYSLLNAYSPIVGLVFALALLVALPWIAVRAVKFNFRMSAWRNVRFGFDGGVGEAAKAFILWPLAAMLSFGILMPLAIYKQQLFILNNARYGTARFHLNPCLKDYYKIFLKALGLLIGAMLLVGLMSAMLHPLAGIAGLVVYFYAFVFVMVRSTNLIFNNLRLRDGDFAFESFYEDYSYGKLVVSNTLLVALTVGLFTPWAMVRTARYKAQHLALQANADLDGFVAAEGEEVSALGEELGDVFDFELGI